MKIIKHSANPAFQNTASRLLKKLSKQHHSLAQSHCTALDKLEQDHTPICGSVLSEMLESEVADNTVVQWSLRQLLQTSIRPVPFKLKYLTPKTKYLQEDWNSSTPSVVPDPLETLDSVDMNILANVEDEAYDDSPQRTYSPGPIELDWENSQDTVISSANIEPCSIDDIIYGATPVSPQSDYLDCNDCDEEDWLCFEESMSQSDDCSLLHDPIIADVEPCGGYKLHADDGLTISRMVSRSMLCCSFLILA